MTFTIIILHSQWSNELFRDEFDSTPAKAMDRTARLSERGGVVYATHRGIIRWAFKDGERIKIKRPKRKGKQHGH